MNLPIPMCRIQACRILWTGTCLLVASSVLQAAPPEVKSVTPPAAQVGTTTTLAFRGKTGDGDLHIWCDRPEIVCSIVEEKPKLQVEVPADAAAGLCWLRLYNAEGSSAPFPLLIGVLPQIDEKEPNNSRSAAQVVSSLPAAVHGVLHKSGEVDLYAVTLKAGDQLVASVAAFEAFASPMDSVLQLVSADGFVVEQIDDHHGNDPQIVFTAPQEGTWYLRLFAFPSEPNSSIVFSGSDDYRYRLSLTVGAFVDHLIRQPAGAPQASGWNLSGNEDVRQLPGLHLWRAPVDETHPAQPIAKTIAANTWNTGVLNASGDSVSTAFTAKKGENFRFQVLAQALGSVLDPVLSITDAEGKVLKELDDTSRDVRDVDFTWKVSGDGTFHLNLTDRFAHGSPRHYFAMTIEPVQPEAELTLTTAQFVIKRGEALEIPVTIVRKNGFAETLTVTALDLPEGVEATEVVSEPKGDSSKAVKLKLKADKAAAFNGPVRIIARTGKEEGDAVTSVATASLPIAGWTTSHIWLTIPPEKSDKK